VSNCSARRTTTPTAKLQVVLRLALAHNVTSKRVHSPTELLVHAVPDD